LFAHPKLALIAAARGNQRLALSAQDVAVARQSSTDEEIFMVSTVRRSLSVVSVVLTLSVQTLPVFAQENFYKGKTIRLIVGLAPGGGFDAYSRVIARHIGKHIPGNPTTVVDNMPGAASLLAANYVQSGAPGWFDYRQFCRWALVPADARVTGS
jgi:hypothetical protein